MAKRAGSGGREKPNSGAATLRRRVAELEAAEQRYRLMLANSADTVALLDKDGRTLWVMESVTELLGYPPEELAGLPIFGLIHAEDLPQIARLHAELLAHPGRCVASEVRCRHKDGSWRWMEGRATNLLATPGVGGIVMNFRDVTARKEAETTLRQGEARWEALVETVPVGIVIHAGDGRLLRCNATALELLGVPAAEAPGKELNDPAWQFLRDDGSVMPIAEFPVTQVLVQQAPVRNLVVGIQRGGDRADVVWVLVNAVPRLAADGSVAEVVVSFMDITARRASEEHYRLLADNTDDFVLLNDITGHRRYVSPSYFRRTGWTLEELQSTDWRGRIHPDDLPRVEEARAANLAGQPTELEHRHRCKDGSWIWVDTHCKPLRGPDGNVQHLLVWSHDITERKQAEAALCESEDRWQELMDHMPSAVQGYRTDGTVVYWNRASEWLYGYTAEEALGRDLGELIIPPELMAEYRQALQLGAAMRQSGEFLPGGELSLLRKDGQRVLVHSTHTAVCSPGRPTTLYCLDVDLTERQQALAALRESEERYRLLADNTEDIVVLNDAAGQRLYISPSFLRKTGWTMDDIQNRDWRDRVHPDDWPAVERARAANLAGQSSATEHRIRCRNGSWMWVESSRKVVCDADGRPRRILVWSHDITACKQMEAALRQSEEHFRQLAEAMPQIIWMTPADGSAGYLSQQWTSYTGLTVEQSRGEGWTTVVHPDDVAAVPALLQRIVATGEPGEIELRVRRAADGQYRWFLCRGLPLKDAQGRVASILGTSTDIDDQKQAQAVLQRSQAELEQLVRERTAALTESEERFRQLASSIHEVFWLRDAAETQMLYISPAYETVWGRTCASLYAEPRSWLAAVHADDRARVVAAELAGRRGGPYTVEYRLVRPDGAVRWIHAHGFPIRNAAGQVYRVAGICEDVTEQKQLERAVLEISEREQRHIGVELHEGLCQVLTGIAFASGVLEQKLSAKASGEAREARQIHDALAEAVGQARLVVRGLCPVEMDAEGLRAALEHLAGNVSHLFHLDCTFTCRQPVQIFNPATALHLYRIAQEAVNNAVQHGQPRHVWVRLGATKDTVTLTVEDDGAGVPAPDRAAAGLGWEIMAYRARMIDGAFAVQPGQTGGTVVTCTCPNQPGAGRDRGGTTA